jgi:hypothetical protein
VDIEGITVCSDADENIEIYVSFTGPNSVFVYGTGTTSFQYHKRLLRTIPIRFVNVVKPSDIYTIIPASISETIFLYSDLLALPNFDEIGRILRYNMHAGFHRNIITDDCQDHITCLLDSKIAGLPKATKSMASPRLSQTLPHRMFPYTLKRKELIESVSHAIGSFVDTDVHRYKSLHRDTLLERYILLSCIKEYIIDYETRISQNYHSRKAALEKRLHDATSSLGPSSSETTKKQDLVISKVYHSLQVLYDDNGKIIHFDPALDPTPYSLRTEALLKDTKDEYIEILKRRIADMMNVTSARDIEHELQSIIDGKRRVRIGEHCVLDIPMGRFLYIRKKVEGKSTWVKVSSLPSAFCIDSPMSYDDLVRAKQSVVDVFANTCDKLSNAATKHEIDRIQRELTLLDDINVVHKSLRKTQEHIEHDIESIQQARAFIPSAELRRNVMQYIHRYHTNLADLVDQDESYYTQGVSQEERGYDSDFMMTYEDQTHHEILHVKEEISYADQQFINSIEPVVTDAIKLICSFSGVKLKADDIRSMLVIMPKLSLNSAVIRDLLVVKEKQIKQSIAKQELFKNEEFLEKFNRIKAHKLEEEEKQLTAVMYHESIVGMIAAFSLHCMNVYPRIQIQDIYPSCVKAFAYVGYPLKTDDSKNLTYYLCCMIKSICTETDPRYSVITKKSTSQLYTDVQKVVDDIIEKSPELLMTVKRNQRILEASLKHHKSKQQANIDVTSMFPGFKPTFASMKQQKNVSPASAIINTIYDIVSEQPATKLTVAKVPTLLNACCLEPLHEDISYFSFLEKHPVEGRALSRLKDTLKKQANGMQDRTTIIYHPKTIPKHITHVDMKSVVHNTFKPVHDHVQFAEHAIVNKEVLHRFLNQNPMFQKDVVLQNAASHYEDDAAWDDEHLMSHIIHDIQSVSVYVKKMRNDVVVQSVDDQTLDTLTNLMMIVGNFDNISVYRHAIQRFVQRDISKCMSRILHKKVKDPIEVKIVQELEKAKYFDAFRKNMYDMLHDAFKSIHTLDIVGDDVKVIILHVRMMYSILHACINTLKSVPKVVHHIMSGFVSLIISMFLETLRDMVLNIDEIRGKEEQLREQDKVKEMSLYDTDDENRHLQMMLKKMGIDKWHDIGVQVIEGLNEEEIVITEQKDEYIAVNPPVNNIQEHMNQREEDMNYRMDYRGEDYDNEEPMGYDDD